MPKLKNSLRNLLQVRAQNAKQKAGGKHTAKAGQKPSQKPNQRSNPSHNSRHGARPNEHASPVSKGPVETSVDQIEASDETEEAPELVPVEEAAPTRDQRPSKHRIPPTMPYQDGDSILLVGEGNLSFARALVEIVPRSLLTATVFDSEKIVMEKYPDAARNIKAVADSGGAVLFGIDATKLEGYRKLRNKRFDKIVFNFPHAGAGIKDQDRNIQINQELLSSFFLSALPFLKSRTTYQDPVDGEIHVTLKEGEPYESWRIKKLAQMTGLLKCATSFEFVPQIYPGYAHRRTIGFQEGISKDHNEELQLKRCRTFVFVRVDAKDDTGTYRPGWNSRHRSRRRRAQDSDRSDSDDAQDGDGDGLGDEDGSNEAE